MGVLMLTWESESKTFGSICIYSEDEFIYDNIILNTLCVREEEKKVMRTVIASVKTRGELPHVSETKTLVDESVNWLYGSTEGRVVITHTISGVNGVMCGSDCSATVDIKNGNAEARALIVEKVSGTNGYSVCRYAYCLASPEITISISVDYKIGSISLNTSGAGEKKAGEGTHTFYASSIMTF